MTTYKSMLSDEKTAALNSKNETASSPTDDTVPRNGLDRRLFPTFGEVVACAIDVVSCLNNANTTLKKSNLNELSKLNKQPFKTPEM